ncbi:glycosyl transferase family 2 [Denitrovibrio acetiphilus DSM 12809]|uniref:Glycosyl transferase family 2 n=1 Tax=Denitrovibrio acetiphilus (strain DSM 12809 / NBRC 114555 / N2460) TaxID=522772 RepID=D4H3R5_DENA2|nr:glycosyltransferase family A protein [Denitrovibrio acetiphilus]ADD69167.1 glycosyl transferase family 2 [Denitrovibrio acetiphilus DSM 12809]
MTFSVIIPVFNRTQTLKTAIESVLAQSFRDFEIIVVDDGSDKSVSSALRPYMPMIRYIRIEKNMGVSYARNIGIREAKGLYTAFLDSDDIWLPDKLSAQHEALTATKLKVCHTNEFWFRKDRFINQGAKHKRHGGMIFDKVLDFCRISPSSVVIHRDVFKTCGVFDSNMRTCEDYDLWLRICSKFEVCYLPEKHIIKRAVTNDQLSDSIKNIEYIRLVSLARFVKCKNIKPTLKVPAIKEISRKALITAGGINNF